MKKLSIVIPAYNEEKRIGSTLKTYGEFFNKLKKRKILDYEILIVINNTKDKTEEVVKEYKKKNNNIRYLNLKPGGKGFAITRGFEDAFKRDSDLIGFVDADMSTSPEAFYDLAKNIGNNYGIIADRYQKNSIVSPKQPLSRIIASRVFNFMIRTFFLMNYRDTQCGAKIFRKEAVKRILPKLGMTQWALDIDMLYQMKKFNLSVIAWPTIWEDKEASKINLKKASIQMFFSIIQLRILNSPVKKTWRIFRPIIGFIYHNLLGDR